MLHLWQQQGKVEKVPLKECSSSNSGTKATVSRNSSLWGEDASCVWKAHRLKQVPSLCLMSRPKDGTNVLNECFTVPMADWERERRPRRVFVGVCLIRMITNNPKASNVQPRHDLWASKEAHLSVVNEDKANNSTKRNEGDKQHIYLYLSTYTHIHTY